MQSTILKQNDEIRDLKDIIEKFKL